jgi:hypothetical protein
MIAIIFQFPLCLYELQRLVINVYDCLCPHNVMFPLTIGLYNGIHFLVIGQVFSDIIEKCLTMVCHQIPMFIENYAHSIVRCVSLNSEWLFQIGK